MCLKPMSLYERRCEFVRLAERRTVTMRELCARFETTTKTGYKWLARYRAEGDAGLRDRSRRPRTLVRRTDAGMERRIIRMRTEQPAWGARKLRKLLQNGGVAPPPAASTITRILSRNGLIGRDGKATPGPFKRFEHPVPNALWQMDFKGWFNTLEGTCHPLTVLDDHARFNLCLDALPNEEGESVRPRLEATFRRFGLPDAILLDNGAPWGSDPDHVHTPLTVWLMRLGVKVIHIRPYHPQTQGKEERFHRTLKEELIGTRQWRNLAHCQEEFNQWRGVYNQVRPHEALDYAVPADRYLPSLRRFPKELPPVEYLEGAVTRKVQQDGHISFRGGSYLVGKAFRGYPVQLVENGDQGGLTVMFMRNKITKICIDDAGRNV